MCVGDMHRKLQGASVGMSGEAEKSLSPKTHKSITAPQFERKTMRETMKHSSVCKHKKAQRHNK